MTTPPRPVRLEREDARLVLTWEPGTAVLVHVGDRPDEAGTPVTGPGPGGTHDSGRLVLEGFDPDVRWYAHVTGGDDDVVVAGERLVVLDGARNFRDLGGYLGLGGRRVRWGRVYRSDHLGQLTEADLGRLERLGIRVVVDYRGPNEHEHTPSTIVPGLPFERLDRPIGDGPKGGESFYAALAGGALTSFGADELAGYYHQILEDSAPVFAEVLGLIADPDRHAVVFHCTAGKDRTGLTAALLLSVLGVDDQDILDDYELTNVYRSGRRVEELRPELAEQGIDIDRFLALFTAPRAALAQGLAGLEERWGSAERYLVDHAGLPVGTVEELRALLLH